MNEITTVGVDLAKEVIVVCAADAAGRAIYFKQFSFAGFAEWAANLPPCLIGMEACSSAHHWARVLSPTAITPKLMAAELVAPFRMSRGAKNDRNDAQAILCAVRQPNMRFVTVKSIDQQAMLAWHRARQADLASARRCSAAPAGCWQSSAYGSDARRLRSRGTSAPSQEEAVPAPGRSLAHTSSICSTGRAIDRCDMRIRVHVKHSEAAQRVQAIGSDPSPPARSLPPLPTRGTSVTVGRCQRGVVWCRAKTAPAESTRLGTITQRGDTYLRGLLTQGARSTLQVALKREPLRRSRLEQWIVALHGRAGYHKTLVAIANKHLRTIWAILAHGETYDPNAWRRQARAA